jgi:selenocysteine-specific elongation factor
MTGPLTLGTAGHIDHGKTALVGALTGVDTDRLAEERERGISIVLGYAPLTLPSGRRVSVIDVPGHERFVRTMVSGATGIDLYLMVVAADDGVMPQTREHAAVLHALGVRDGVVAITKSDLAEPARALAEAHELLPRAQLVVCCARTGDGIAAVASALDRVADGLPGRAGGDPDAPAVLHIDRSFTVAGLGTVVTGTLWAGTLRNGEALRLLPGERPVRVRSLQVHDEPVERAAAGQRVAVALGGVRARDVRRGDALTGAGSGVGERLVLDAALAIPGARHDERVQALHGTRHSPGRLADLGDGLWQLRLERPLLAADGDRVVVRRLSPPDTLGGGRILDAAAARHGRREDLLERLRARRDGRPEPVAAPAATPRPVPARPAAAAVDAAAIERLHARLREAGPGLLSEAQLGEDAPALAPLRAEGRAVRVSGTLYADADVVADMRQRIVALLEREGAASLAQVRDALGVSRKSAQAFLEHLDGQRVTRREPDDRRVLRKARSAS